MLRRHSPIRRSAKITARRPVKRVNRARRTKAFARAYWSEERVAWVRMLPCAVCGFAPSENAHTKSGGMGRKADAATIAPLCTEHHEELHRIGAGTFARTYGVDLAAVATNTEAAWRKRCALEGIDG